jgi:general secretion pathway protein K
MPPRFRRRAERGIALIMVLGAVSVLTVVLAEFQDEAGAEVAASNADRDSVQAEYLARSAVSLTRLLIATEPVVRRTVAPLFQMMRRTPPQLPIWEYADRILAAFNDSAATREFASSVGIDLSQAKNLGLEGGRFEVKVVDEDAKINANLGASNQIAHIRIARELMGLMNGPQYDRLFDRMDPRGQTHERSQICSAIIDWADLDEQRFDCNVTEVNSGGATSEDSFYANLPKPYRRKNGPFDSLEELHLVRGVTDDFWATFIEPDPTRPEKRTMTVWSQGTVNVNSANVQALVAVICSDAREADLCKDPQQAALFSMGLNMARGVAMGVPIFGNTDEFIATMKGEGLLGPLLAGIGVKKVNFRSPNEFKKTIATESKVFSVYAVGVVKGYKRETRSLVHAVVDYRDAPPLGGRGPGGAPGGAPGGPPGGAPGGAPGLPGGTQLRGNEAFLSALAPNPGGRLLYFRVE